MVNYADWLLDVKPTLHFWSHPNVLFCVRNEQSVSSVLLTLADFRHARTGVPARGLNWML